MSTGRVKNDKPLPPALDVFRHAVRFMFAEERLRHAADQDISQEAILLAMPSNVMAAFTIELFLKTLIIMDGNRPKDGHRLGLLFSKVETSKKERLSDLWSVSQVVREPNYRFIEQKTGIRVPRDLQGILTVCGEPFVDIRYYYEDTSKAKFLLSELPRMLFDFILTLKPEWR